MYDLHFLSVVGTHFSRSGPNLSKERLLKGAECDTPHLTKMGRRLDRRPNHRRPIRWLLQADFLTSLWHPRTTPCYPNAAKITNFGSAGYETVVTCCTGRIDDAPPSSHATTPPHPAATAGMTMTAANGDVRHSRRQQ